LPEQVKRETITEVNELVDRDFRLSLQPFNVLILYDSVASGTSAVSTYQRLIHNLATGYFFSLKLWRFDMLETAERSRWAIRDVTEADMVIVAWSCAATALSSRRTWVDQWPVVSLDSRRALVSLFTGPRAEEDQCAFNVEHEFLHALAERTGMDLISSRPAKTDPGRMKAVPILVSNPGRYPQEWSFADTSHDLPPAPRWGINE
jgi:hypothetical protein